MPSALLAYLVGALVLLAVVGVTVGVALPTYHRHKLERTRAHIYALELELGLEPSVTPPRPYTVADRWKDGVSGKAANYTEPVYRGLTANFVHCPKCRKTVPLARGRCALCMHKEQGWS